MVSPRASLYIHIPFCASFCDYCDFYSVSANSYNDENIKTFLSALITDIKSQIDFFSVKEIPACYIGGGTPSVLGKNIVILFDALKALPSFSPFEFTIEANPESLTEDFLISCIEGGVNRLSLGVQTFHEPSRLAVNRQGGTLLNERLTLASRFFPPGQEEKTLSVDLVTGLPFSNEKTTLEDIKRILNFVPSHISLYSLTIEKNTPLGEKIKNKTVTLPESDISDSLWLSGKEALKKAGFEHYEVSNFAYSGKRCLHNIRYWQMQNWIGAGPSASGTIINDEAGCESRGTRAARFTFAPNVDIYNDQVLKNNLLIPVKNDQICGYEEIDNKVLLKETLLMGFRYIDGHDKCLFKQRFGYTIEDCIPQTIKKWEGKDKMLFLNSFLTDAFEEIDKSE
ncbi:MAG: coproporphyrinogen III oxidase family protein [Treponema sp.]|nr:coproporphyrinogen III oxidase family protein [Treponema sp.]